MSFHTTSVHRVVPRFLPKLPFLGSGNLRPVTTSYRTGLSAKVSLVMRELRGDDSLSDFANRLGEELHRRIDRTQVANWEAGRFIPRADVLLAAARVTRVPRAQWPTPLGE